MFSGDYQKRATSVRAPDAFQKRAFAKTALQIAERVRVALSATLLSFDAVT
jgi:hypothetical protein